MPTLRILTWHVHGSYLWYLAHVGHELFLPIRHGRPEGYGGRSGDFAWPANVHEVPAEDVASLRLDAVLLQSRRNWDLDQHEILSPAQRRLPRVYLEHDPPRESPTDTRHHVDDPNVLLVHVTPFNRLMWDSGRTPTTVVEHGVVERPRLRATYEIERGLVVVNNIAGRGRRLGLDVFEALRRDVPLDLIGLGSEVVGGLGPVPLADLPSFSARYRFFFNPIRYTSLGLAVCEAMMLGLPVIGLATTEMATVVENGVSGYVDTDPGRLRERMLELLADPAEARRLGEGARRRARERFSIERFRRDWDRVFREVTGTQRSDARTGGRSRLVSVGAPPAAHAEPEVAA